MKQKTKSKQSKIGKKYEIELSEKIGIRDSIKAKQKRPGYKRPIKEIFQGYKPSRDKEKYPLGVTEDRSIDRIKNTYDQVVKNNLTGKICHEEHEPLSEHKGKRETKSKTKFKQTEIGKIPEEWEVKKVKDVAKINEQTVSSSFKYEEIEYIDISSVDKGRITEIRKLPLTKAPSRAKRIVRDNDVILSTVRPNLKHFAFIEKANPNTIVSTGFAVISPKKIVPRFLYYYLTTDHYTNYLTAIADTHTSAYPAFNPDVIEESNIPYPPINEQKAIARILSSLDDKIELNQQMNKTLEAIAQAIFKHWFIDFEFPNEEGKPYKSSGGEMVYNEELGKEIPKGWEVDGITRLIEFNPTMKLEKNKKYFFISMSDVEPNSMVCNHHFKEYTGSGARFTFGDTLLARITPSLEHGKTAFVGFLREGQFGFGSTEFIVMHPKKPFLHEFVYLFAREKNFRDYAVKSMTGSSGRQRVPREALERYKFVIPSEYILENFHAILNPLFHQIFTNYSESKILAQIRSILLPKLMSGEIRVTYRSDNGR